METTEITRWYTPLSDGSLMRYARSPGEKDWVLSIWEPEGWHYLRRVSDSTVRMLRRRRELKEHLPLAVEEAKRLARLDADRMRRDLDYRLQYLTSLDGGVEG